MSRKLFSHIGRPRRITLVTNIDFETWAEYLGDAPLAMALLDRVVDGATIVKSKGKSYRVGRSAALIDWLKANKPLP